jgi:outer membrane protein OmpA-like peptidoglycan-associated protein
LDLGRIVSVATAAEPARIRSIPDGEREYTIMAIDIIDAVSSTLGGITRQASTLFGESESGTRAALSAGSTSMLAGLLQEANDPHRARDLFNVVTSGGVDSAIERKLPALLGDRGHLQGLLSTGETLLGSLFGSRSSGIAQALSQVSGVKPGSATSLLALAAPVLLGFLKKQVSTGGLDAGGLTSLLGSQREHLLRSGLDDRLTSALGFSNLPNMMNSISPTVKRQAEAVRSSVASAVPERRNWIPWAIAAGIVALLLGFLWTRAARHDANVAQDTASRLTTAAMNVYFETGQSDLDPADRRTLRSVAEAAKASGKPITLTGYTDPSGDQQQNETLAKDRAAAVRLALLSDGVADSQIIMKPPAAVTGSGTEAQARRVEVTTAP